MRIWVKPDRLAQLKLTPTDLHARDQRAERAVRRRQDRPVADGDGPGPRLHDHHAGSPRRPEGIRAHHRTREPGRLDGAPLGRRAGRARLPRLRLHRPLQRQARRRWSASSCSPAPTRSKSRRACATTMAELSTRFPEGLTYAIPYDTTRFVEVSIREVVYHARRGDGAGDPGRVPVPAELARDADPAGRRCRCR